MRLRNPYSDEMAIRRFTSDEECGNPKCMKCLIISDNSLLGIWVWKNFENHL